MALQRGWRAERMKFAEQGSITMAKTNRVAVVQAASTPFDADAAVDKTVRLIRDAGAGGARLALFPEAFIGGYPKGCTFDTPVGARLPGAREAFRRYFAGAIEVPSDATARIAEAARETGVFVVVGVIERSGGTLYCTALFFDPEKGLVGKHRKLMPTAAERLIWGFGDGSTLATAESAVGRVGSVICWETTCRCCERRCTPKACRSIARRPRTIATLGFTRCATSRWKAAAMY